MTLSADLTARLAAAGLDPAGVAALVQRSLAEDLDGGVDVTSQATVAADLTSTADFVARGEVGGGGQVCRDGARVHSGEVVLTVTGPTRALLTGERTALNLLCHLSGVATLTRRWADAIDGTGAQVRDTRKTTPGLRVLEKYAVRCGGGTNHRMSLSDAALVKDNHVVAAGGVTAAFAAVRAMWPGLPVEVEVDSLAELDQALSAGADLVLLDNMSPDLIRQAVRHTAGRARLEASGGLSLANARVVAETGVDYIAVGALTHSAPVLDIGLDLRENR